MKPRWKTTAAVLITTAFGTLAGDGCAPATSSGNTTCTDLTGYTASTSTPVSFANDIYPILADVNLPAGCGQTTICHGNPPSGLDNLTANKKTLQFLYDPPDMAMARSNLLMASVNAPSMQRVVPGNVGQSLLAYKISGREGLACVNSMCVAGASLGNNMPCGDPMPSTGDPLSATNRTKILDWIAQGAMNN